MTGCEDLTLQNIRMVSPSLILAEGSMESSTVEMSKKREELAELCWCILKNQMKLKKSKRIRSIKVK